MLPAGTIEEVGSDWGGWAIPIDVVGQSWTCYCAGAGGDISLDIELARRFGATVRAFDPVPEYVQAATDESAGQPRVSVHQLAVATSDGPLRMQITHDQSSRSMSPAGLYESQTTVETAGRTLMTLMSEFGDHHIDLLKLDIEGGEYALLPTISPRELGVQVLAVQFHHNGSVSDARRIVDDLRRQSYYPVACRPAARLTFVRADLLPARDRTQTKPDDGATT